MFNNHLKFAVPLPARRPALLIEGKSCLVMLLLVLLSRLALPSAFARDQWEVYNPNQPPPQTPPPHGAVIPGTNGFVPKVTSDFWQQQISNRVAAGTVFSGILEDDLSSNKSKRGDVFSLRLQDGFAANGNQIIPPNTRIVGSVTDVVSARNLRQGQPGTISVSLQSLVFPDGRNIPFFGYISWNPTLQGKAPTNSGNGTVNKVDRMATGFLGTISSRVGFAVARPRMFDPGNEIAIAKGEVLPVRLNKALVIQPQGFTQPNAGNPLGASMPETTLPPQVSKTTPWMQPANYSSNPYGKTAPPAVPGLVGADAQGAQMSYRPGGTAPNVPGAIGGQSLTPKALAPYVPQNAPQAWQNASQGSAAATDTEPF